MFQSLDLPTIPQWLGKAAVGAVILAGLWVVGAFANSGFITPGDVLKKVEANQTQIIDLQKDMLRLHSDYQSLQSRALAIQEQMDRRVTRLENNDDARTLADRRAKNP